MRSLRPLLRTSAIAFTLALTSGCAFADTPSPIPGVKQVSDERRPASTLVVFLPGFGDHPEKYLEHDVPGRLRASADDIDTIALDGHFGYYANGELWHRVHEDVVMPARERGQRVWIFGISMGGIGALMTASEYRAQIDGLVLMSPYTGRRRTMRQIASAGGPKQWQPPEGRGRWDAELWRWLRDYDPNAGDYPEIFLGYGLDESGADKHFPLLASLLPEDHVYTAQGSHEWDTWDQLWDAMLPQVASAIERGAPPPG